MNADKHILAVINTIKLGHVNNFKNSPQGKGGDINTVLDMLYTQTLKTGTDLPSSEGLFTILIDKRTKTCYTAARLTLAGKDFSILVRSEDKSYKIIYVK